MKAEIVIAKNITEELTGLLERAPVFENERGSLYISDQVPVACIRLKISKEEYFTFLREVPEGEFSGAHQVVPVDNEPFDIIINGNVEVIDDAITINGKKASIL